jgi:WD40 repeat protein/serine/threonine protein kinase/tetratricopeptide (TPR) repeat protein
MDEQTIFLQALEKPSGEQRTAWLDQVCGADKPLRERIESLLYWHEQAGGFLIKPAHDLPAPTVVDPVGEHPTPPIQADLVTAFGHEQATVVGHAGHTVLKSLAQTLDEIPSVALRDPPPECAQQVLRPPSPEVPKRDSDSRYRLEGEIARGGMGVVLKGRDIDLGRELAIKVLLEAHKNKPDVIQRFIEEAQIGGQLQHPGIAPVYELGQFSDRRPFFSMKLVKGETLSSLLARRKEPAEDRGRFLGIFEQVCQTMAYAHSRGVIHRDLKPANIMVGTFGEVQVMDWGLAKVLPPGDVLDEKKIHEGQQRQSMIQTVRSGDGSEVPGVVGTVDSQTQTGSVMGTLAYMPPEQALGEIANLDERADVFGLGAILCETLTGKPPYVGEDASQIYRMASCSKLDACFERLDSCGADAELIALTKHCLEPEPANRPRDAGVLAQRVTNYLESVEVKLRETELERAAEAARVVELRRRRKLLYAIAALLVVGFVGSGFAAIHFRTLEGAQRTLAHSNELLATEREAERNAAISAREQEGKQRKLAEAATTRAEAQTRRAENAKHEAEHQRDLNRRNLYIAQMQLAYQAWRQVRGVPHMSEILNGWATGEAPVMRGWEWYYLKSLEHAELLMINVDQVWQSTCAWSPDGRRLVIAGVDNVIRVCDPRNGQILRTLTGHAAPVTSLSFSPNGSQIVSGSVDQSVRIWDVTTGLALATLRGHGNAVATVAWSHNAKWIASGATDKAVIWEVETGAPIVTLPASCEGVAWAPHDDQVLTQGDRTTRVWNARTGESLRILGTDDTRREILALSPDGKIAATTNQAEVVLRDVSTGTLLKNLRGHGMPPLSLDFSHDGKRLASAGEDQSVRIWDVQTGAELFALRGHTQNITRVRWHPAGDRLATAAGDVRVWTTSFQDDGLAIRTADDQCIALCWSPDASRIATGGRRGTIQVWDLESRELRAEMKDGELGIPSLAWHPQHPWLASASYDGVFKLWSTENGQLVREIARSDGGHARTLNWSPGGDRIALAGQNQKREITIWDSTTWKPVGTLAAAGDYVSCVAWSPDASRIAAATADGFVKVWDAHTCLPAQILSPHEGTLNALAWSSHGDRLAAAGDQGIIWIWDAKQWELLADLHGHTAIVYSLCWNQDDTRLCSSSQDNTVRLWDASTWAEVITLRHNKDQVPMVAWDPLSTRLASVDFRGLLHVLDAKNALKRYAPPVPSSVVGRRLERNPSDMTALKLHWRSSLENGRAKAAADDRERLIKLYRQRLALSPSAALASELANVLLTADMRTPHWQPLALVELKSESRCALTQQPDGSIFAGPAETPQGDCYSIRCRSPIRRVTMLQLETLPHPGLPVHGQGWGGGNFHLTNFRADVQRAGGARLPLKFRSAASDIVRSIDATTSVLDGPWGAIDGAAATRWDIWPGVTSPHWLELKLDEQLDLAANDELIIHLEFRDPRWPAARLGCFRLSASDGAQDSAKRQLIAAIRAGEVAGFDALAAAYIVLDDPTQALNALGTSPDALDAVARPMLHALTQRALGDSTAARAFTNQLIQSLKTNRCPRMLQGICGDIALATRGLDRREFLHLLEQDATNLELARLTKEIEANPTSMPQFIQRGTVFARLGRWRECSADYLQAAKLKPEERLLWGMASAPLLLSGDTDGYQQHCHDMLKQFAGTELADVADTVCKCSLLLPAVLPLSDLPIKVVRTGASDPKWDQVFHTWFFACNALISFREGNPAQAIEWTTRMPVLTDEPGALTLVVRAMSEAKLGRHEQAVQSLAQAEKLIPAALRSLGTASYAGQLPVPERTIAPDWLVAEILRREAEVLILGNARAEGKP